MYIPNGLAIVAFVAVFSVLISVVGQCSLVQKPQDPAPPTCFIVLGSVFVEHQTFPLRSRVHYICSKRLHGMSLERWNTTKIISNIWQFFHVYWIGDWKKGKKLKSHDGFFSYLPIKPMGQQFFALSRSALKKLSWELNLLYIF